MLQSNHFFLGTLTAHGLLGIFTLLYTFFICIKLLKVFSFFFYCSEYLEVHQTELDKLMSLMKDMKRNSRLVRSYTSVYIHPASPTAQSDILGNILMLSCKELDDNNNTTLISVL